MTLAAYAPHLNDADHVLGAVVLAGVATTVGALVYLHVARTGLSPIRNAVSQYGITDRRVGYRVQTIAMATSLAALGVAVAAAWHGAGHGVIVALLLAAAAARAAISWYPMDAPGAERTSTGRTHGLLAIVAFVGVSDAALRSSRLLQNVPGWDGLRNASTLWAIVMGASLGAMVVVAVVPGGRRVFGLVERLFYLGALGYLAASGGAFLFIR
ncbi:MAG: DUF998 domain-containing protein [Acidimicrobiales bacterium]